MANSALIDDLLKQFAENPRRVFARLANEYRKRGELQSAIEICRSHVPLQPGYISGHIVLGQALYDSGSLEEARSSFETALALDPENLIALRHMGDIARAGGDVEGARKWYRQLLEIDPQNEEVAALLESLGAPDGGVKSERAAEPEAHTEGGYATPEAIEAGARAEAHEEVASSAPVAQDAAADASIVPDAAEDTGHAILLDEGFDFSAAAPTEGGADPVESSAVVAQVEGLETTSFEGAKELNETALESIELDDPFSETTGTTTDTPAAPAAVAPLFPAESPDFGDDAADDVGTHAFATQTMAELYLQQGHRDRALAIYRELIARNPNDRSMQERIAELTAAEAAPPAPEPSTRMRTAREFFGVLAYRRPPRETAAVPVEVEEPRSETQQESVGWQEAASVPAGEEVESGWVPDAVTPLSQESSAEPTAASDAAEAPVVESTIDPVETRTEFPTEPGPVRNGRPGREADTALSLDDVFRDSPVTEVSGSGNTISFDEFFARRVNGSAEDTGEGAAAGTDAASQDAARSDDDEPKDLELFNAWLDGLKR